jgi:hypothetical protein
MIRDRASGGEPTDCDTEHTSGSFGLVSGYNSLSASPQSTNKGFPAALRFTGMLIGKQSVRLLNGMAVDPGFGQRWLMTPDDRT